mmetsp:Transcript_44770/g.104315  ORF Transcript_44770/g.104315 Transcript_44770/m.104315 type:complete len:192 (+) Transcript_44770:109-684(+)
MASKLYDFFVAGYDVAKFGGTNFFHTSVVVCPSAAKLSREKLQDSHNLHMLLERAGCEEMIFDRNETGIWFNQDRGRWSLEEDQTSMVHWRYAGQVRLLGATALEASEKLKRWAATPAAGNFTAGTYHLVDHNCNSFTAAILRKVGFDPQKVLACGSSSCSARDSTSKVPCLAPENAAFSPTMHRRLLTFL